MSKKVRAPGLLILLVLAGTGCAVKHLSAPLGSDVRPAVDVPDHFMTSTSTGRAEPKPDEGCRSPLIDPRDDTHLTLIRSGEGRGDYLPEPLRYGLREDELLEVDCETGRSVGIVKR